MQAREAFPSCEVCGAIVRRQLMRFHHAWHDDLTYAPARLGVDAEESEADARLDVGATEG